MAPQVGPQPFLANLRGIETEPITEEEWREQSF